MKNSSNKFLICLTLISTIIFTNCNSSNQEEEDVILSIQSKIELLESSEWLVKDFENRVMHTFKDAQRFTYYGIDTVFSEDPIPGTQAYTITGTLLKMDFNFGNIKTYNLVFSCDNTIVKFYEEGVLNTTLYKRDSNYMQCL